MIFVERISYIYKDKILQLWGTDTESLKMFYNRFQTIWQRFIARLIEEHTLL